MFRALTLSLALSGSAAWQERTEQFAGLTCPTLQDVAVIESIQQNYLLGDWIVRRTHCLFVTFDGVRRGETADFSIGGTLYNFLIVEAEGHTVYVLNSKGEEFVA